MPHNEILYPYRIYNLTREEINNPNMVFKGLFRQNDLPGLRQLNTGLLRSAIKGNGFDDRTPCEQSTFIRYSSEMARVLEAIYLLQLRRRNIAAYRAIQQEASQGGRLIVHDFRPSQDRKTNHN